MLPPSSVCPGTPAEPCSPLSHNPPQFGLIPKHAEGCAASRHLGYLHSPGEKDAQQYQPQQELLTTSHGLDFTPPGLGRM